MKKDEATCRGCRFSWLGEVSPHFVRWQCRDGAKPWALIKVDALGCKNWRKK